jgi:flagellar FliJ protein
MKKFEFRLEPVLRLRDQTERIKQREFAQAVQEVRRCESDILYVLGEIEDSREGLRRAEIQEIDPWQLIFHRRYLNHLEKQLRRLRGELQALSKKAESKRLELVKASKEKKSLEKLRGKQRGEYEYEAAREEQKMFDEIGGVFKERGKEA